MVRLAPRAILIIVVALGIAVAAPLHALAMTQPCTQMSTDDLVDTTMGQAGETMAEQVGSGDAGSNMTGTGTGALASMDCAQHCSNLGTVNQMLGAVRHLADTPIANGISSFTLVFPELDPSPPRPGTAS